MLVTVYKIGKVQRMKNLMLRARVVVRTSKMKISRRCLANYVKQLRQKACITCSSVMCPHSANQIINFEALPLSSLFLKLSIWFMTEQTKGLGPFFLDVTRSRVRPTPSLARWPNGRWFWLPFNGYESGDFVEK